MFYFEFSTVIYLFLWDQTFWCSRCRFELGGASRSVRGVRDRYVCVSHFFTANLFKHARVLVSVRKMKYFLPSQSSVSNKVITPDFKWLIKALLLMALEYLRNKVYSWQKDSILTKLQSPTMTQMKTYQWFYFYNSLLDYWVFVAVSCLYIYVHL